MVHPSGISETRATGHDDDDHGYERPSTSWSRSTPSTSCRPTRGSPSRSCAARARCSSTPRAREYLDFLGRSRGDVARPRTPGRRRRDRRSGAHAAPRLEPLLQRRAARARRACSTGCSAAAAGCSSRTPAPRPTSARSSSPAATGRRTAGPSATTSSRPTARSTAARSPRSPRPASPQKQETFQPLPTGFRQVSFADVDALARPIDDRVCAVLLEPVQGEGGVQPAPPGYLEAVRALCDEREALLIVDEVQTGLGRTGRWFGFQHAEGVRPDIVTMAKALGNGVPIGACWARADVAAASAPGDHATTFGGQPLAARAALAVLDVMAGRRRPGPAPARAGTRLTHGCSRRFPAGRGVRGAGLLLAAELRDGRRRQGGRRRVPDRRAGRQRGHTDRDAPRAAAARERRRDRRRRSPSSPRSSQ